MGSGSAAESARRPAARERLGQRRGMYRMRSVSAAESARRTASRERRRGMYLMGSGSAAGLHRSKACGRQGFELSGTFFVTLTDVDTERRSRSGTRAGIVLQTLVIFFPSRARPKGSLRVGQAGPGRCPGCYDPPTNPKPRSGQENETSSRETAGTAAESARRPASRERQGQRRRMYLMGSGAAA